MNKSKKNNEITDCFIKISKEDMKILDLIIKTSDSINVTFYSDDDKHFLFTELKDGKISNMNHDEIGEKIYKEFHNFMRRKVSGNAFKNT